MKALELGEEDNLAALARLREEKLSNEIDSATELGKQRGKADAAMQREWDTEKHLATERKGALPEEKYSALTEEKNNLAKALKDLSADFHQSTAESAQVCLCLTSAMFVTLL